MCLLEPLTPTSTISTRSAPETHLFHFERCSQCPSVRSSLRCNSTPDSFTHSAIFRRKWLFNPIKTQKNTDHQGLLILSCCSKVFFNLELVFVLTAQACLKEGIWLGLFGNPWPATVMVVATLVIIITTIVWVSRAAHYPQFFKMPVTSRTLLFSIKYTAQKPKKYTLPHPEAHSHLFYCGRPIPTQIVFFTNNTKKERTHPLFLLANGPTFVFFNIA